MLTVLGVFIKRVVLTYIICNTNTVNVVGLVGPFKRYVFQHKLGLTVTVVFSRVSFLSVFREEGLGILPKEMRRGVTQFMVPLGGM